MLFPFATTGAGILIPVSTAKQIQKAIVIHVEHGDAFGVIRAETVSEKSDAGLTIRSIARLLHAELSGVSRILGVTRTVDKKRQDEQQCSVPGQDLHGSPWEGMR